MDVGLLGLSLDSLMVTQNIEIYIGLGPHCEITRTLSPMLVDYIACVCM
jgi:hypothetical protein